MLVIFFHFIYTKQGIKIHIVYCWIISIRTYTTYPYLEILAEQVRKIDEIFVLAERKYGKRNFISLAFKAEQKRGRRTSHLCKSRQRWNAEVDLPILESPGRTSVEDERDLSKSWPSGSTESGTLDLRQSRQSRSAEEELHIFWSPGRDEMGKWTYPYWKFLAERVRKMNEIFPSPGRAEVWKAELQKAELQIFGSKYRAEMRKQSFRPLKVLAELKCRSWTSDRWQPRQDGRAEAELHILRRIGRAEMWNGFHVTSLVVRQNGSAGAEFQIFGSSVMFCHVGSVEAELYIFDRPLSYWLQLPMLTNNSTDCYNCHSQWRTMWRPGVAKTQDFRNALDKVIMLPQGLWVILIWALS